MPISNTLTGLHVKTASPSPKKKTDTIDLRLITVDFHNHHGELLERILNHPLLPTPPTLALQVIEKTRHADCRIDEVSNMLAQDPTLCGQLFKILNSSLYGLATPVYSISRAVTMLGMKPLRFLVLGLTMSTMHGSMKLDDGLRKYWRDSVAGAIITREVAQQLRFAAPEEDMVASLLRDLGMLLLRQSFADLYDPVWAHGSISHAQQCEWEEKNLGVHHADVGAAMLERWRLPAEIVQPIRFHHHPDLLPAMAATIAVRTHLLDLTSRLARMDDMTFDTGDVRQILDAALDRFGLDRATVELYLSAVSSKIKDFAAVLNLDIGDCPNFGEILAASSEELIQSSLERVSAAPLDASFGDDPNATSDERLRRNSGNLLRCDVSEDDSCEEFFFKLTRGAEKTRLQQYEIIDMIGKGAMGLVVKAHDIALDRDVALKFLAPRLVKSRHARARFAMEARFAAAIRNDHVVTIFAVSEWAGLPFLVMEYVEGKSLQDYLDNGVDLTVADVARVGRQTALGLAAAHDLRIIHRDIKPANLILGDAGRRVRITDFGVARAMDMEVSVSQQGTVVGTPTFMSPEQIDGQTLTPASDLFSLGSVLYTLCTGRHPFAAESFTALLNAVAQKTPTPIREINPAVPDWLVDLVGKLHIKDPTTRFGPASAVAAYLTAHVPQKK